MKLYELQLAVLDLNLKEVKTVTKLLPSDFKLNDRTTSKWGHVIVNNVHYEDYDLEECFIDFFGEIADVVPLVCNKSTVLRIAVFYTTMNCSLVFNNAQLNNIISTEIEVSTYPIDEDEV